jgi:4-hydroxy-tetrahydrodipicolinate reductase
MANDMRERRGPVRVIQMGLGPIGRRVVEYVAEHRGLELVAALDIDPALRGRDAGEVSGIARLGVAVSDDTAATLALPADVVSLTTASHLEGLLPQLEACVSAGKSVVSTCEELAHPFETAPAIAKRIDHLAKKHQVVVLGTGVNPGFLMDALPTFLSSVCRDVKSIRVERYQDASIRRLPFQQKIGAGLSPQEFETKRKSGRIRHVGFTESIRMIARALGWELERIDDEVAPVLAERAVRSRFVEVAAGMCAGLRQLGHGWVDGKPLITLELQAYIGHPDPRDTVIIDGIPPIRSTIQGGVDGDVATCSMVVNAIGAALSAPPGLRTMLDIPLTSWSRRA